MAELTLQEQAALIANAVQPTQPEVKISTESITLKGTDIYGKMKPFSTNPRDYKAQSMEGEQYYLYRFMGTIITMPSKFHGDYVAYEVLEVTLTGAARQVEDADPNQPGGKRTVIRQSYGYDGHLTTNDEIAMLKLDKHKAKVKQAKKNIEKIDVTKALTDAELEALIGEA